MIESVEYFSNARTALKIGLLNNNIKVNSFVLVPESICDVLIHPFIQLKINVIFYSVDNQFSPNWKCLENLAKSNNCCAVVMVHYFGQSQEIKRFLEFCYRYNLFLIEDNAHGSGGYFGKKCLGKFGDIGISSPRKFLSIASGGVLFQNKKSFSKINFNLAPFPIFRLKFISKKILINFKIIYKYVIRLKNKNNDWSNPYLYKEKVQPDYKIDNYSFSKIASTNWPSMAKERRKNWLAWECFVRSKGLQPVFSAVNLESCPWAFPVYAADVNERDWWLSWGVQNDLSLFPWPSLPESVVDLNGDALERWRRMICFPLEFGPKDLGIVTD